MDVQLFSTGQFGKSKNVTAQQRLNCYLEFQPQGDRSQVAIYGTPGLDLFVSSFGDTPVRGLWQKRDFLYAVHRGTLYQINNAGVTTVLGTLNSTSGRVYIADNGTQMMLTDGTDGYIYTFDAVAPQTISAIDNVGVIAGLTTAAPHGLVAGTEITVSGTTPAAYSGTFRVLQVVSSTEFTYEMLSDPGGSASVVGAYTVSQFAQIVDEGYPRAETVTWQDSYFIVNPPNSQRFYISAINNGYVWDALDFASAESNPDDIVVVASDNGNLHLFGDISTEMWTNTGSLDFPFERISGAANEWGCAAPQSVVKYDNSLAFIAKNRMGEVIIARLNGYLPQRISTPELEYIINNYTSVTDAVAFSYMLGGHPMLEISFPSAEATWLYDGLSNCWSKIESNGIDRHRCQLGINYLDRIIVSDFENGNLYRLNPNTFTDNGQPIAFEVITRHIADDNDRLTVDELKINIESGVGLSTGQGSDPQIMLQISKDGGHTWGTEIWTTMGKIGEYRKFAEWRRLGQGRDFTFKFRITDPVKRVIFGASMRIRKAVT